jgi:uncharacterized protein (TIRG00374 family)
VQTDLITRFRRSALLAVSLGAIFYLGWALWADVGAVSARLAAFDWRWALPVVALTLLNYALRFGKWRLYLRVLGVDMPLLADATTFLGAIAMTITPGKLGELLKPYVVRELTGTPMARTVPALVSDRLTDVIAMMLLTALGISRYAAEQTGVLITMAVVLASGFAVLLSERLSRALIGLAGHLPVVGRFAPKLTELYEATRVCLAPVPLLATVTISVVAWFAQCLAFGWVFEGFGIDSDIGIATFVYAASTILGAWMPGGLGATDAGLAAGVVALQGIDTQTASAAAFITRLITLWMGVGMGAVALLRVSAMLGKPIQLDEEPSGPPPAAP